MPFRFRFKSLLRHREFKLRQAQAALGAAESVRMRIQSGIERLAEIIRLESEQMEKEQHKGIETARYLHFKVHLSLLERELLMSYNELKKASEEVQKCKQAMIECDKSVKVLENIETRDRESYRLIQSREEQKKLNDIAVFSDYRNRAGRKGES
ncbi:MAG: flagellar FliJ family protein [Syntrophobacteraceae bacterium]|jgi:flagellar export protein FliJ